MTQKRYNEFKKQYMAYKDFLLKNESRYQLADKLTSEGIVEGLGLSVGTMDNVYKQASYFYIQYNLVKALVEQLEDVGLGLVTERN